MYINVFHLEWLRKEAEVNLAGSGIEPSTQVGESTVGLHARLGISRGQVAVVHGAQEGIFLSLLALFQRGDRILIPLPEYRPLVELAQIAGLTVVRSPWGQIVERLEEVDGVLLSTPNNPLGKTVDVQGLSRRCSTLGCRAVLDETFSFFTGSIDWRPLPSLLRVFTTSKICNFTDRKAGWVIGDDEEVSLLLKAQEIVSPPPVQTVERLASYVVGELETFVSRARKIVEGNLRVLRESGVPFYHSGFLPFTFLDLPSKVAYDLYRRGILVLPGEAFDVSWGMRISLGKSDVSPMERLLKELSSFPLR